MRSGFCRTTHFPSTFFFPRALRTAHARSRSRDLWHADTSVATVREQQMRGGPCKSNGAAVIAGATSILPSAAASLSMAVQREGRKLEASFNAGVVD